VYIIGHRNPDTDSICSSIAYADIKNRIAKENENDVLASFDPQNIVDHWEEIREIIAAIPSAEELTELFKSIGAVHSSEEIGISSDLTEDMLSVSAAIRNRLTLIRMRRVLDFA